MDNLDKIEEQIRSNMRKAWCDVIEERIKQNPPDFEYIVDLYKEMKVKFTYILKEGSKTRNDIESSLDVDLFRQMIVNDVFDRSNFCDLTYYVFQTCISLGSPSRDDETIKYRDELIKLINDAETIYFVVPKFFLYINTCIDWIYEDISKLKKH